MKNYLSNCGATGKTPNLKIGEVKTISHDEKAYVEINGDRENPILNFGIPKGKDGAKVIIKEVEIKNPESGGGANQGQNDSLINEKIKILENRILELETELESTLNYEEQEGFFLKANTTNSKIKINKVIGLTNIKKSPSSSNPELKEIENIFDNEKYLKLIAHGKNFFNIKNSKKLIDPTAHIESETNKQIIINSAKEKYSQIFYYINVEPNKTYSLTAELSNMNVHVFDDIVSDWVQEKYLGKITGLDGEETSTFTPTNSVITIRVTNEGAQGVNKCENLILEQNSSITEYEEYKERVEIVQLDLDEGLKSLPFDGYDSIEKINGEFYIFRRVGKLDINSKLQGIRQNWITESLSQYVIPVPEGHEIKNESGVGYKTEENIFCNSKPVKDLNEGLNNVYLRGNYAIYFNCSPNLKTVENFKNWLDENPTFIYYKKANVLKTKINLKTTIKSFNGLTYFRLDNEVKGKVNCYLSIKR